MTNKTRIYIFSVSLLPLRLYGNMRQLDNKSQATSFSSCWVVLNHHKTFQWPQIAWFHLCLLDIFSSKSPMLLSAFPTSLPHECVCNPYQFFSQLQFMARRSHDKMAFPVSILSLLFCLSAVFIAVTWLAGPKREDTVLNPHENRFPPNPALPFWMKSLLREPGLTLIFPKHSSA